MLNPQLSAMKQVVPIPGELLLLSRDGLTCEIAVKGFPQLKSPGHLILTTQRMVFINTKPIALGDNQFFTSFQFPLASLSQERFNQPIFSANNLTGIVQPTESTGLTSEVSFKIVFREGGCGTFLHFFLRALRELRVGSTHMQKVAREGRLQVENAGFMDPSDPSVVFVVQPAGVHQ